MHFRLTICVVDNTQGTMKCLIKYCSQSEEYRCVNSNKCNPNMILFQIVRKHLLKYTYVSELVNLKMKYVISGKCVMNTLGMTGQGQIYHVVAVCKQNNG